MSVRPVLRYGDPRLQVVAEPVTKFDSPHLAALIRDLFDTMAAERGAGLAAPQIGVPLRVVVFGYARRDDFPDCDSVPPTVLVNPVIEPLEDAIESAWEGCLSVPGMRGLVPRYRRIRYRARDPAGAPLSCEADRFHARVVQHECDHLDGVLYPQRIRDWRDFGFLEELTRAGRLGEGGLPCEDVPDLGA